ncbi:hypothetical protein CBR_g20260 [Chara braunii]|uniref:Uncharacterized protein n=1 Tax=Chara braunii TaxID=69332 RepID=A0A388L028_CHABU|nr:hypothetical protein CBR_g20260 [Chara braunii]|eukprot:GBG75631.1 hypothetical protein CBR_g20260 [Chara braunii]
MIKVVTIIIISVCRSLSLSPPSSSSNFNITILRYQVIPIKDVFTLADSVLAVLADLQRLAVHPEGITVDKMIKETTRRRSAELLNLKDTVAHPERDSIRLSASLKKTLDEHKRKNKVAEAADMNKSTELPSLGQQQQERGAPGANGSSQSGQPQQEEVVDPDLTPPLQSQRRSERGNPNVSSRVRRASASVQPSQPRPCPVHGFHKDSAPTHRACRERRNNSEAGAKYLSDHNHVPGWMAAEKDFFTTSGQMASSANGAESQGGSNGNIDIIAGAVAGVPESFRNGSAVPPRTQAACHGKRTNSEMSIDLDDNTAPLKRCHYDHGTSSGSLRGRHCKQNPPEPTGDNSATKRRCAERTDRRSRQGHATCSECSKPLDEKLQELEDAIEELSEEIRRKDVMIRILEKKSAEQVTMIKYQHSTISSMCRVNNSLYETNKILEERVENLGGSAELW